MSLKYCITMLSVLELKEVKEEYGNFSYDYIVNFHNNAKAYNASLKSIIDVIYVYGLQLKNETELGGIFSSNIYATNEGIYGLDSRGEIYRFHDNSTIYIFRIGNIPKSYGSFVTLYAKKYFGINIVFPLMIVGIEILSSKCHNLFFSGINTPLQSVIPFVNNKKDIYYLCEFIRYYFPSRGKIIIKKGGTSSGEGIQVLDLSSSFDEKVEDFLEGHLEKDYIISGLLEVTDLEYRVYWIKDHTKKIHILEIHGKRRKKGMILHNIAQGNRLEKVDKNKISSLLNDTITQFCKALPESYGGLDVIETYNGEYICTENNIMTGYLSEDEEAYFAKDWLTNIANYHKNEF